MIIKSKSIERHIKSIIPKYIKTLIVSLLVNNFFGYLIKLSKCDKTIIGGYFDYSLVSDAEAAKIFWGFWESGEIRFSRRFANSNTIIELGSSVGVTLGNLSNNSKNKKFVCVEASKINFDKLLKLKNNLRSCNEYVLIHAALAYGKKQLFFNHSSTVSSSIYDNNSAKGISVEAITLNKILEANSINEKYTLITDIEGAESEIFFHDEISLNNCETIIAELEDTERYSIKDQEKRLEDIGFKLKEKYANLVVYEK
tara:strand:+ start:167 stop:934 length:768 start_codon:yes stop_codon:yes gene_type:complete